MYLDFRSVWPVIGLHSGLNVMANGFSDSDWKTGGFVRLVGVSSDIKSWASGAVLSLAALSYYFYCSRKRRK